MGMGSLSLVFQRDNVLVFMLLPQINHNFVLVKLLSWTTGA